MTYKFVNNQRNYSDYYFYNSTTLAKEELDINPIQQKLLNHDNFDIDQDGIKIIHSITRLATCMPGVLILKDNKVYGRRGNSMLYKCIPDDTRLPSFLIPYNITSNVREFSKKYENKYIVFKFMNWDEKHPIGQIHQTIGDVSELTNFYEYMLYCKSLNASMNPFNKDTSTALRKKSTDEYISDIMKKHPNIEDRTHKDIYTIDPRGSKDFDDAFGLSKGEDKDTLSIYITNVPIWIDMLELWSSFSKRVATIYLPDRKRPLLPTILSDSICSLQEGELRFALVLDLDIKNYTIVGFAIKNTLIKVKKNYIYEEQAMKDNSDYNYLFNMVAEMNKIEKYSNRINNSHDVILYLMVLMNYICSGEMKKFGNGIYRSVTSSGEANLPDNIPDDVSTFINIWKNSSGAYCEYSDIKSHDLLKLDSYMHITSPIRRLVDLLNIYQIQINLGLAKFNGSLFYDSWLSELSYINLSMRGIRKIQCDCDLLHLCSTNKKVLDEEYDGYVFDKLKREDGLYQYIAYLPKLKVLSRLTMRNDMINYSHGIFRLYLFNDEAHFKRKIRVQMV